MRTIAILNRKGGVAKTTTAVNLAAILARDHGRRVLVADADSQGNATTFLGGDRDAVGMAALLRGEVSAASPLPLQKTSVEGVRLISGSDELMDLDLTKAGDGRADAQCLRKLRALLEETHGTEPPELAAILYGEPVDYMLIDCPPAFNAASSAALVAADEVLIPVKLDAFALEGMANLLQQIQNMRRINPRLRVLGVLPVMWYRSEAVVKAEGALRGAGLNVLPRIRRSDRVDDMTYAQAPLIVCSPRSGPCQDYRRLAAWLEGPAGRGTDCHTSAAALARNDRTDGVLREHDVGKRGRGRPRKERIATAACAQTSSERRTLPARRDARNDMTEGGAGNG